VIKKENGEHPVANSTICSPFSLLI